MWSLSIFKNRLPRAKGRKGDRVQGRATLKPKVESFYQHYAHDWSSDDHWKGLRAWNLQEGNQNRRHLQIQYSRQEDQPPLESIHQESEATLWEYRIERKDGPIPIDSTSWLIISIIYIITHLRPAPSCLNLISMFLRLKNCHHHHHLIIYLILIIHKML